MGDNNRAANMLRAIEGVVYWIVIAPILARLPAALGYRIACWRGDLRFRLQPRLRDEMAINLQSVFGDELSPEAIQRVIRERFRLVACEPVDVKRLRNTGRSLQRLIEIRGREHLETALAAGKGVILCTAHVGSYHSGFSVLHASGFPVTTVGRWGHNYRTDIPAFERWLYDRVYAKPVRRHRQRPYIEPWHGRPEVALMTAAALRANEVVTICIDAPPLDSELVRTVKVPFLGRQARLVPGAVALAQMTGAPLLMGFLHRSADYRHQVWEISAPVQMDGEGTTAFERCISEVSAVIRRSPAHWDFWGDASDLAKLGLIDPSRGKLQVADTARFI